MPDFCPGYSKEPFRTLASECPGEEVFPRAAFRVEWGPIFHRGRLDGSACVLVIGQDPASHEAILRRILVGRAGRRLQGFLAKLGVERRYVMVNVFAYSVYGQQSGEANASNGAIAAYRHRWLDAIFEPGNIEAVVALGTLAERAWKKWKKTVNGKRFDPVFVRILHPTAPEAIGKKNAAKVATATKEMLAQWNTALVKLAPAIHHPDVPRSLMPYDAVWREGDEQPIPDHDVPAGTPDWMRIADDWAVRTGITAALKRRCIVVTVPSA